MRTFNHTRESQKLTLFLISTAIICLIQITAFSQINPNAQYATFSPAVGQFGTGSFNCPELPGFEYSITGDVAPGGINIPASPQTILNNGGGIETNYGQADAAQNMEIEIAAYTGMAGDPITNQVQTTINFNSVVPANELAFIINDIEQDQVMICALDPNGNPVPVAVIATWFQASFDANPNDPTTLNPTWDPATGTIVGQEAIAGVKQLFYQSSLPDNEAGSAWFEVNIPISQLVFKSEALGVGPDHPSHHFFLAGACTMTMEEKCKAKVNVFSPQ